MAKQTEVTIKLDKDRETDNTVRFAEEGEKDTHVTGKLYVKKTALKKLGNPDKLEVVIRGRK